MLPPIDEISNEWGDKEVSVILSSFLFIKSLPMLSLSQDSPLQTLHVSKANLNMPYCFHFDSHLFLTKNCHIRANHPRINITRLFLQQQSYCKIYLHRHLIEKTEFYW